MPQFTFSIWGYLFLLCYWDLYRAFLTEGYSYPRFFFSPTLHFHLHFLAILFALQGVFHYGMVCLNSTPFIIILILIIIKLGLSGRTGSRIGWYRTNWLVKGLRSHTYLSVCTYTHIGLGKRIKRVPALNFVHLLSRGVMAPKKRQHPQASSLSYLTATWGP